MVFVLEEVVAKCPRDGQAATHAPRGHKTARIHDALCLCRLVGLVVAGLKGGFSVAAENSTVTCE